jgi:AraC-like DNA-binding protein
LIERLRDLTAKPEKVGETKSMDVVSEILRAVKLRGALFFHGEFSAPWCFRSERSASADQGLASMVQADGPTRLFLFHFLTEGRAFARLEGGRQEELNAGDIVILPHGDIHYMGNGSPEKPVDSFKVFAPCLEDGLKTVRFGGGGEITRFVCGFMACDPRLSEVFLAGLPPLLKVSVTQGPSGQWIEQSIRFTVDQNQSWPGSGLVVAKLSEVLFVETLRSYINSLPPDQTGWLAGTRDPAVGQALALMHKEPGHPWTIADLGKRVGLSRTRLAERFRHFLGDSPMAYLAAWRLKLGAEMLQSGEASVAEVAASVGYGSEAAFNRAFKREFGRPPAQFRRQSTAPASA